MRMWLLHPECKETITNGWNDSSADCPMFVPTKNKFGLPINNVRRSINKHLQNFIII